MNTIEQFKNGRQVKKAAKSPTYEKDWSDKLEPYAAGIGLAGDVIGLGTAATGVGIPVGTVIAGFANIPNLIIDGYQTARDTWRSFNDGGNSLGSAAWNGGEFLLDVAGLKALQYINKAQRAGVSAEQVISSMERKATHPYKRVGTGASRSRLRKSAESKRSYNAGRNKALEESTSTLAKKGVRETQGEYFRRKLADEMAKRGYGVAVNDAIRSANRTVRQNLATVSTVSGGTNVYHIVPKHQSGGRTGFLTPAEQRYLEWSKMTPEQQREYRTNRAKAHLQSGPNVTNFWEAFQTYIGNRDPENPHLNVGVINVVGTPMSSLSAVSTASRAMGGPKNVFSLTKLWRMVNKRIGRSLDSEEFSDLISNSSITSIRNAAIETDNNFPIIRITEQEANDFINSLRPGSK